MRPSVVKPWGHQNIWGLLLLVLLPLVLVACASAPSQVTQPLIEKSGDSLVALTAQPASKPAEKPDPLQVCAVVPDEELQEMRGCLGGTYHFAFIMDFNLVGTPEVSVKYSASVPEGSPAPTLNGATAYYSDGNVFYMAGPNSTGSGLMSQVIVTGHDNIVFSTAEFNFQMPNAANLIPSITILPQTSLSGIK